MAIAVCVNCGNEFRSYNPSPRFCSLRCKGDHQAPPIDIAEMTRLYQSGLSQTEVAEQMGVTQKSVHKAMRRHGIEARPAIKRDQRRERNSTWKGDGAGYQAFHRRLDSLFGKPRQCEVCGTSEESRTYEWANLTGYYEDINDYKRMCRHCHRQYDAARRKGGDAK